MKWILGMSFLLYNYKLVKYLLCNLFISNIIRQAPTYLKDIYNFHNSSSNLILNLEAKNRIVWINFSTSQLLIKWIKIYDKLWKEYLPLCACHMNNVKPVYIFFQTQYLYREQAFYFSTVHRSLLESDNLRNIFIYYKWLLGNRTFSFP